MVTSKCNKRQRMNATTTMMSTITVLVLSIFITGSNSRTPPTIINISDSFNSVSILTSENLTLECEGQEPVTWITHNQNNINNRAHIKAFKTGSNNSYHATLLVTNTIFTDTGRFTCSYNATNDSQNPEGKAEIYVFIKDPDHLFLQCSSTISLCIIPVPQAMESVIPCLPTSLDVNVTLWKEEPTQIIIEHEYDISFDPTRGYVIAFGSSFYSGQFNCIGKLGDKTEALYFVLYWIPSSDFPAPIIHQKVKYAILNSNYSMVCSIKLPRTTYVSIRWQHPVAESSRIITGNQTSTVKVMQNGEVYQEIRSELTILRVQNEDRGFYTCTAIDSTGKSKQKSVYIETKEKMDAFIKFTLSGNIPNNTFILSLANTTQVKFVVNVDAFPDDPQMTWYKYHEALNDRRKYFIRSTKTSSSLAIFDIKRNDTGRYVLLGTTDHLSANITIILILTEPPVINILPSINLYGLTETFTISCHVQGCPTGLHSTSWEWSQCSNSDRCDETNFRTLNATMDNNDIITKNSYFGHGCHVWNNVSGIMTVPGYYRCSAENPYGTAIADVPLFITEVLMLPGKTDYSWTVQLKIRAVNIENAGEYICEAKSIQSTDHWETKTTLISVTEVQPPEILKTNLNNSVTEVFKEDPVEFICEVTGSPSPSIMWYLNGSSLLEFKSSAIEFNNNGTRLFISRAIRSDSGFYTCEAQNKVGKVLLNTTLVVLDMTRTQFSTTRAAVIITVVLVFALVAIALGTVLGRKIWKEKVNYVLLQLKKKKEKEYEQLQHMLMKRGNLESYNPDLPLEDQVDCLPYDNQWEFPKDRLKLERIIGQGAFGRVVRAKAMRILQGQEFTTVAVKMLKERASIEERRALMQELKIMIHLGHNINVVNLLGAITENLHKGELMVIIEYCRFGNLRHYLLKNRDDFVSQIHPTTGEIDLSVLLRTTPNDFFGRDSTSTSTAASSGLSNTRDSNLLSNGTESLLSDGSVNNNRLSTNTMKSGASEMLTTHQLIYYAFQISNGMKYLALQKLVHRDLALRNVLLADGHIAKICDFGLSKDLYTKMYYRRKGKGPLPVKWMAVESICDQVFSSESDVWSFGIVLWETFTLGANPYPGIEVNDEFYKKLINGYRMEKPILSTGSIYTLMTECWQQEPKARPTFDQICIRLRAMLDERILNRNTLTQSNIPSRTSTASASAAKLPDHPILNVHQTDYVPCDSGPINISPNHETATYVNLPLSRARTADVAVRGDTNADEIRPLMQTSRQLSHAPDMKTSNNTGPETPLVISDSLPKDHQSAYLDMGSKLSLSNDL